VSIQVGGALGVAIVGSLLSTRYQDQMTTAFEGRCPPTFRAEYLPAGKEPHCIDFILTATGIKAESAGVLFAGKVALPGGPGYASDHIGLYASLLLAPP
jgi:endonuclease/exonuclease/phosphatase family metal-dependent hydrolase